MKKILLFIVMLVPIMLFASGTHIPAGPVSGHWTIQDSPYFIDGEIYVEKGAVLVLHEGVELRFTGFHKMIVYGSLVAAGEKENYIRFTSDMPGKYRWNGLRFMQNTTNSIMEYCIIEHSQSILDATSIPENGGGGVQIMYSAGQVTLRNCIVRNNEAWFGGGIQILYANPTIEKCQVENNVAVNGGGIEIHAAGRPIIKECRIAYNNADYGAGISMINAFPFIQSNKILHNTASVSGGGIRAGSCLSFTIQKNIIAYNKAKNGGGVYLFYSNGDLNANTVTLNEALNMGGGYFMNNSSTYHRSDLIYFNNALTNGHQVYLGSLNSDPDFEHCNIRGGTLGFSGPGAGPNFNGLWKACIDGDPLFDLSLNEDFNITWDNYPYVDGTRSPCIDAGCPGVFVEPDGTCCDIGAKCYLQVIETPAGLDNFVNVSSVYFIARWDKSYGALGYYLDVAYDPKFVKMVPGYDNLMISEDTVYPVLLPMYRDYWYYRVRAYNSVLLSPFSFSQVVPMFNPGIDEAAEGQVKMFAVNRDLHVNLDPGITNSGELMIYNMSGQLIDQLGVSPGDNTYAIPGAEQIVIVKLLINNNVYQQKLLLH